MTNSSCHGNYQTQIQLTSTKKPELLKALIDLNQLQPMTDGIVYAYIGRFDIDRPEVNLAIIKCGGKSVNRSITVNKNTSRPSLCTICKKDIKSNHVVYQLSGNLSFMDASGELHHFEISEHAAEQLIGLNAYNFYSSSLKIKTNIKTKLLFEPICIRFEITSHGIPRLLEITNITLGKMLNTLQSIEQQ
ncbi:hypothetical protein BDF19DRAFT_410199 [Syncephalis fuscata]|nr:hypothetical protein BDF19DRAFT_410199 [Syncephalis fuscata]